MAFEVHDRIVALAAVAAAAVGEHGRTVVVGLMQTGPDADSPADDGPTRGTSGSKPSSGAAPEPSPLGTPDRGPAPLDGFLPEPDPDSDPGAGVGGSVVFGAGWPLHRQLSSLLGLDWSVPDRRCRFPGCRRPELPPAATSREVSVLRGKLTAPGTSEQTATTTPNTYPDSPPC